MDIFAQALQGSYAYLLIFQIVLVSALFLVLLGLIVRRTKEAALISAEAVEVAAASLAASATLDAAAPAQTAPTEAAAEATPPGQDSKALTEKVKFLESKLLEYEILQEEIGTLSALKLENEQLRKKLHLPPTQEEEASQESAKKEPQAPKQEPVKEPEAALVAEAKKEPGFEDSAEVEEKALIFDAPKSTPASPPEPPVTGDSAPNLESLLEQIDELTKRPPTLSG